MLQYSVHVTHTCQKATAIYNLKLVLSHLDHHFLVSIIWPSGQSPRTMGLFITPG